MTEAYRKSVAAQRHPRRHRGACRTCARSRSGIWVETGLARRARDARRHLPPDRAPRLQGHRHPLAPRTIARAIDSVGGQMDAFTAKEHTCFYVQVLDEHLPLAVDLLTDILLQPLFAADDIEKEKAVVLQEIKMVEDTPDDLIHDLFAEQVWAGPPARAADPRALGAWSTAFDRDTILELLRATSTCPARIIVAVAGHVEHERVVELFAAGFEGFARPAGPRTRRAAHACRPACTSSPSRSSRCTWSWASPASPTPRPSATRSTCSTTSSAAACPRGSSRRCASGRRSSTRSTPGTQAYRDTGLFYVYAGTDAGELRQGAQGAAEGDPRAQEGRGHRRRAAPVQGPSQGQPHALARVHVQSA